MNLRTAKIRAKLILRMAEDQPRDEAGRWTDEGGSSRTIRMVTAAEEAIGASSRFKPKDTVMFGDKIVGPSGAQLTSYTWQYKKIEETDARGEPVIRRISDWDASIQNQETGRDIVHQFQVKMPDGSIQNVSSESAMQLLGYTEKTDKGSTGRVISAAKTLAKNTLKLDAAEHRLAILDAAKAEVDKLPVPEPRLVQSRIPGVLAVQIGDVQDTFVREAKTTSDPISEERRRVAIGAWKEKRFQEMTGVPEYKLYMLKRDRDDLKARVERQRRALVTPG